MVWGGGHDVVKEVDARDDGEDVVLDDHLVLVGIAALLRDHQDKGLLVKQPRDAAQRSVS